MTWEINITVRLPRRNASTKKSTTQVRQRHTNRPRHQHCQLTPFVWKDFCSWRQNLLSEMLCYSNDSACKFSWIKMFLLAQFRVYSDTINCSAKLSYTSRKQYYKALRLQALIIIIIIIKHSRFTKWEAASSSHYSVTSPIFSNACLSSRFCNKAMQKITKIRHWWDSSQQMDADGIEMFSLFVS